MKGLDAAVGALNALQARIKFSEAAHRYSVDGRPMPSVTGLIKQMATPQLEAWKIKRQAEGTARAAYLNPPLPNEPADAYAARMRVLAEELFEADRIADEAAVEGTEVHALIEHRIRKMLGEDTPRPVVSEAAAFREAGFMEWAKSVDLRPIKAEFRLVNWALRYCGTADLLAWIKGEVGLLDYKRAKAVYDSHHLQSIGYRMGLEEIGFERMPGYVLLMPPGGEPQLAPCRDDDVTREAFKACVSLYNFGRSLKR